MGTHKGRKKRVRQGNPKLHRPDYLNRTNGGAGHGVTASFGDGAAGLENPQAVPFPPASTSQDAFLDNVLGLLKSTVDLNGLELEEEQDQSTGVGKPASTFLDHLPLIKRFARAPVQTEKAAAEDFGQFVVSSFAKDKATRAELRRIMLTTRHNYERDLGGRENLVQGERNYIDTICFLCLVEHLISMASVRRGVVKENRSTGKVQSQPILEKLMGAVLNQKRLYIGSLYALHKLVADGFGNGRRAQGNSNLPLNSAGRPYAVDTESDGTVEGDMAVVNEMNRIAGKPPQTPEEVVAEFKTLYEWPPPTDGSPPIPLRRK